NDSMAIGAAKAISDAGKTDEIKVYGVDATPDGLDAISKGTMHGTVSQDTSGMGKLSVETMLQIINGEDPGDEVLTTPVWITAENVDEYIK
ncbi:MAG TPA: sugar ABC transporter substrate-binding protein, partial [Clostridiaceae bacterium]|nr:sugar ABC transporter substrate-binding protein [Clostridiaceae bacterium]